VSKKLPDTLEGTYWLYKTDSKEKFSVWKVVPFPEEKESLASSPRIGDDICLELIIDLIVYSTKPELVSPQKYSYSSDRLRDLTYWEQIQSEDIELFILGAV